LIAGAVLQTNFAFEVTGDDGRFRIRHYVPRARRKRTRRQAGRRGRLEGQRRRLSGR
jgi:hypothetical protein